MLRPFSGRTWGKTWQARRISRRGRKRLLYRSVYRGNKENDILLGQFARAQIATFDAAELDQYERLTSQRATTISSTGSQGQAEIPPEADTTGAAQAFGVSREVLGHGS